MVDGGWWESRLAGRQASRQASRQAIIALIEIDGP